MLKTQPAILLEMWEKQGSSVRNSGLCVKLCENIQVLQLQSLDKSKQNTTRILKLCVLILYSSLGLII